ncbi:MAG TPA: response regulator transcription factor [Acetobacteraceae bacterium]|nr:response regulator transcription factor [Acetobacteraceae bacterium]
MTAALRILLRTDDPVRQQGLEAMLQAAGHTVVDDTPDVVLCDIDHDMATPPEAEAPVVALNDHPHPGEPSAGVLPRTVSTTQLDAALRAVAAGLLVRWPGAASADGFRPAREDAPLLTPREAEILALVGQGMSNKEAARALGISVHTVKFHLEALFTKLDATSRAEAVAKGLRGGVIEL